MITSFTIKDCRLIKVPTFTDERGTISVMDKELPFDVKRVFWLHHIKEGQSRGGHALLEGSEIICSMHGSFVLELYDGVDKVEIEMNNPLVGVMIRPGIWFSTHSYRNDGISLILADEIYSRERYTYELEEYLRLRKKGLRV
jgi:dTDP-4-dehydrorhamnose 3,5-epimerase-like enzyme